MNLILENVSDGFAKAIKTIASVANIKIRTIDNEADFRKEYEKEGKIKAFDNAKNAFKESRFYSKIQNYLIQ